MYLIALCDDEAAELKKTEQMLSSYEKNHPEIGFMIQCFENAEELLYMVRDRNYTPDLILMDIYMPGRTGIEAAKELREMGSEGKIIFLTTSREYALDAFEVDAAQYLVKPISEQTLYPILDKLLKHIEDEYRRYVLLRVEGRTRRVAVSNITYCEAQGKNQKIYLADGRQYLLRMTMTELVETLCRYQEFVRVGGSYIVNLEHVDGLNAQEIQMTDGRNIYLPRGSYKSLREKYFGYYCAEKD